MSVDSVFQALGDPTRRALLERLGDGPLSVSQLAAPLAVSLAAVVQHLQVLEQSDLIRTEKVGRVRTCAIAPGGLDIGRPHHRADGGVLDDGQFRERPDDLEGAGNTAAAEFMRLYAVGPLALPATPSVVLLLLLVVTAVSGLLMVVMRALLRQATTLRTDLEGVI